jgi:hypothetical protein
VKGVFLTIDEGNQTKRVVIGLGAGQSRVEFLVRTFHTSVLGDRLVKECEIEPRSSYEPGMAETMGVGAAGFSEKRVRVLRSRPVQGQVEPARKSR